jgi:Transmembrane domain of unknown function (DUF3566)
MSDRTQGSVRTESPSGDVAAPNSTAPAAGPPGSATQVISTTGSQRAQGPTTGSTPAGATAAGATAAGATAAGATAAGATAADAPAGKPTGGRAGAPPVPSAAGTSPAVEGGSVVGGRTTGRTASRSGGRGPRRARLQLRHIDTCSALKISLVLSIALFFIWMVAVGILYGVLSALGVFDTLNDLFGQIGSASGAENGGDVVTWGVVFWGAAVIGAINIVLMTALCTVGTFIYNLCSDLVGGLELTLSERD